MSDNGRFYEAIESGSDSPHQKYSEEGGEFFNSIACPIRFRFDREFFSEGNDGGGDGEGGCCGLADEIAGDGAEGHCEEHRDQAHRRADDAEDRLRLEFLKRLKRVRVDWRDCSNERRGDDDEAERTLDNSDALKEGGEKESRYDDGDEEKNCSRGKYAAH